MFNLRDFIKGGLIKAVGKMADYQVILNSVGWLEKGVLTEDDLAEIQSTIEACACEPEEFSEEVEPSEDDIAESENEVSEE